jgi:hypothetical protein
MTEPLIFDGLTYISINDDASGPHLSTENLSHLRNLICGATCHAILSAHPPSKT